MFDVTVVGMGPNGLSVLNELNKCSLKVVGLDKGEVCNHIKSYPKDMVFFSTAEKLTLDNFEMGLGFGTNPTLQDACRYYEDFVDRNNLEILTFSKVEKISGKNNNFTLFLNKGKKIHSKKIVLTTGIYSNPNYIDIPGEKELNVSHYYSGSEKLNKKEILVVGAGNSAVEAAMDLSERNRVVLMFRKEGLDRKKIKSWIYPKFIDIVNSGKIEIINNASLISLEDSEAIIKTKFVGGAIFDPPSGKPERPFEKEIMSKMKMKFDYCFLLTGYKPDKKFLIEECGLELEGELEVPKHNPKNYETTIKGIYIAGALVEGMNSHRVFIENGRLHGSPIAKDIYEKLQI
tara:strand:- start:22 stop:1059 length:1038 start_codon:yes stop_codon:yes gene_type:complete